MAGQENRNAALVLPSGFDALQVAEMPSYINKYSKRGNAFDAETTPVYNQARFGNRRGKGGMGAYLSILEDGAAQFDSLKQKRGESGVFEATRWAPGYDWRGNFGVASLSELKNYSMATRGGQLRGGGPKRQDYSERPDFWVQAIRPGIGVSRFVQTNDNYSGVFESKKRTSYVIERFNDPLVLREMIETNPFHIRSHAAIQAKKGYDEEFPNASNAAFDAYRSDFRQLPSMYAQDLSQYVRQDLDMQENY